MSGIKVKIKYGDVTKYQQLSDKYKDFIALSLKNLGLKEDFMNNHYLSLISSNNQIEQNTIIYDETGFNKIYSDIVENKVNGTAKFEFVLKSNFMKLNFEDENISENIKEVNINVNTNNLSNNSQTNLKNENLNKIDHNNVNEFVNYDTLPNNYKDILKNKQNVIEKEKNDILNTTHSDIRKVNDININNNTKSQIQFEEIKIKQLLQKELKSIEESIFSKITNVLNTSSISKIQEPNGNFSKLNKTSKPVVGICSICKYPNIYDFVYYCTNENCNGQIICAQCEDEHFPEDSDHTLVKSYKSLNFKPKILKDKNFSENYNFSYMTSQNTFSVCEGKNIDVYVDIKNIGKSVWLKNFEIYCIKESEVIGKSLILKNNFPPNSIFNAELKLNTSNLKKGSYTSLWKMKNNKGEEFENVIKIIIRVE